MMFAAILFKTGKLSSSILYFTKFKATSVETSVFACVKNPNFGALHAPKGPETFT